MVSFLLMYMDNGQRRESRVQIEWDRLVDRLKILGREVNQKNSAKAGELNKR